MLKLFTYLLLVEFPALQVMVNLIQFELSSRPEVFPFKMGICDLTFLTLHLYTIIGIKESVWIPLSFSEFKFSEAIITSFGIISNFYYVTHTHICKI